MLRISRFMARVLIIVVAVPCFVTLAAQTSDSPAPATKPSDDSTMALPTNPTITAGPWEQPQIIGPDGPARLAMNDSGPNPWLGHKYGLVGASAGPIVVASTSDIGTARSFFSSELGRPGYVATLDGSSFGRPVETNASGHLALWISEDGESINYQLTVSGIADVMDVKLCLGMGTVEGPAVATLLNKPKAGPFSGMISEGAIRRGDLQNVFPGMDLSVLKEKLQHGLCFVRVDTKDHPQGAIRGQVLVMPE